MEIINMPDPERVRDGPVQTMDIASGSFREAGYVIKKIQLRLYVEGTHPKLGPYSLITSRVETDRGTIEMIYDEGYRGEDALYGAGRFLTEHLGVSGVILRSVIALREAPDHP